MQLLQAKRREILEEIPRDKAHRRAAINKAIVQNFTSSEKRAAKSHEKQKKARLRALKVRPF